MAGVQRLTAKHRALRHGRRVAFALALLAASPAYAQIPVTDAASIAQRAVLAAQQMTELLKQVQGLKDLVSASTIANAVLGPDAGAGWGDFFNSVSDLYNEASNTATMINSIPYDINRQAQVFMPPPEGSGLRGYLWKIREIKALLNEHNLHAIATQSTLTRAQAEYAQNAAKGSQQILKAKGQMEVEQLSGVMLGNISAQLGGVSQTLSDIDLRDAIKDQDEAVRKTKRDEQHALAMQELDIILGKGPGAMSQNPINWGR